MSKQENVMDGTIKKSSISRRDFLKLSGTVAALATIGELAGGEPLTSLVDKGFAQQTQATQDQWFPSACAMCDANCAIRVHVVNGVPVKIEGDPTSPDNKGVICARSNAGIMQVYNPYR